MISDDLDTDLAVTGMCIVVCFVAWLVTGPLPKRVPKKRYKKADVAA